MINKKGITYYKLISQYDGDYTKECSLTGTEIDSNFNFLRGYDIKGVTYDNNTKTLNLVRLNGEVIPVKDFEVKTDISLEGSYFDDVKKELHIFVNGVEYVIKCDQTEYLRVVYSNDTIKGNGTIGDPISLSNTLITGFFKPTDAVIDLTNPENTLPKDADNGDSYITKEYISPYGLLYNFDGVKEIMEYLKTENNGWRVPTTEEYGNMLNWLEECEDRKHNDEKMAYYSIGKRAALGIKAKHTSNKVDDNPWETEYDDMEISNIYGFSALPGGHITNKKTKTLNGFGEEAVFWTSSVHQDMVNAYTRKLLKFDNGVTNDIEAFYNYCSLRLVKDVEYGVADVEVIGGVPYDVVFLPYVDKDGKKGTLAWTKVNVTFNNMLIDGNGNAMEIDNEAVQKEVHWFINTWEGTHWEKRELVDNSVVILKEGLDGVENEEWQLLNNEWVKRSDIFTEIVEKNITKKFYDALDKERDERIKADDNLKILIENEMNERIEADEYLYSVISGETESRIEEDGKIKDYIASEVNRLDKVDASLFEHLKAEALDRIENDEKLQDNIDSEADARMKADIVLQENIDAEANVREEVDNDIIKKLNTEIVNREDGDILLNDRVDTEISERKEADKILQENIDKEATSRIEEDNRLLKLIEDETKLREDEDVKYDNISKERDDILQKNIDKETEAREMADDLLQDNIDAEANARKESDIQLQKNIDTKITRSEFDVEYIPEDKKIKFTIGSGEFTNDFRYLRVNDFLKDSTVTDVRVESLTLNGEKEPENALVITWGDGESEGNRREIPISRLVGELFEVEELSQEYLTLEDFKFKVHIGNKDDINQGGLVSYVQFLELQSKLEELINNGGTGGNTPVVGNLATDIVLTSDNWIKLKFADGSLSKGFDASGIISTTNPDELAKKVETLEATVNELQKRLDSIGSGTVTAVKSTDSDITVSEPDDNGVVYLTLNGITGE